MIERPRFPPEKKYDYGSVEVDIQLSQIKISCVEVYVSVSTASTGRELTKTVAQITHPAWIN
jgi:hypothetical protein